MFAYCRRQGNASKMKLQNGFRIANHQVFPEGDPNDIRISSASALNNGMKTMVNESCAERQTSGSAAAKAEATTAFADVEPIPTEVPSDGLSTGETL